MQPAAADATTVPRRVYGSLDRRKRYLSSSCKTAPSTIPLAVKLTHRDTLCRPEQSPNDAWGWGSGGSPTVVPRQVEKEKEKQEQEQEEEKEEEREVEAEVGGEELLRLRITYFPQGNQTGRAYGLYELFSD